MRNSAFSLFALSLLTVPLVAQTTVYSYSVPSPGSGVGFDPAGNLLSYTDNVNGNSTMTYDQLNRLQSATVTTGPYQGLGLAITYDSFGNRLTQTPSGPPSTGPVPTRSANYDLSNKITSSSALLGASCSDSNGNNLCYDAAGNVKFDGLNQMAYDAENRVCAVLANGSVTQYLYDAEGRRVAKGHSASNSGALVCSLGGTDFVPAETYVLGQSGEQVTQLDGSGNWQHTNVHAAGQLLATYDTTGSGLHFHIADPLGSRRVQVSSTGNVELNWANLPFGDNLTPSGTGTDSTEHHFTGKERDAESGLDYFGARYYSSSVGRFMSPDWAAKPEAVPYSSLDNPQSLNLYVYVGNNPLSQTDADGHWPGLGIALSTTVARIPSWSQVKSGFIGAAKGVAATLSFFQGDNSRSLSQIAATDSLNAPSNSAEAAGSLVGAVALAGFGGAISVSTSASAAIETESAGITSLISPGDLNAGQSANFSRFEGSLPSGANPTDIHPLPNGGAAFQAEVPGKVPGSSATYEKQVDATGTTINYTKTTTTPSGDIAHVKVKYQEPQQ
jgi:RHS repeat-associated protein